MAYGLKTSSYDPLSFVISKESLNLPITKVAQGDD